MTTIGQARRAGGSAARRHGPFTLGRICLVALIVLIGAILLDTTYRSDDAEPAGRAQKFDAAEFGAENYESKVVPAIQQKWQAVVTSFCPCHCHKGDLAMNFINVDLPDAA